MRSVARYKIRRPIQDPSPAPKRRIAPTAVGFAGTFVTTGSDGTFNFWDKDSRQRLKAFAKASAPIPCGGFNREGNIYAYAVSYDWSKGSEHYNPRSNHILLHPVPEAEIKSRNNAKKGFGARR